MQQHVPTARRRTWFAAPVAAVVTALAMCGAAGAATPSPAGGPTLEPVQAGTAQQGIIMSDGRICNPRWGC